MGSSKTIHFAHFIRSVAATRRGFPNPKSQFFEAKPQK